MLNMYVRVCSRLCVFRRISLVRYASVKTKAPCESIPVLYIKAKTNYDVGKKIGKTFKHFIETHGASRTGRILQAFYDSALGKEVYDGAVAATQKYYPYLLEEMRGIAKGSGIPFEKIFLHNMVSDILILHAHGDLVALEDVELEDSDEEIPGCSDVLVNTERCRLIAHNEDWEDDVDNISYLVDVEVDKSSMKEIEGSEDETESDILRRKLSMRSERYIAFMFPGNLAGNTFMVSRKFAFTINSLIPTSVNKGAVPVDILVRALLNCETIDECVAVMTNDPVGCSYGINVNIASRETKDMWSLEVYPSNGETQVSLHHIPYQTDQDEKTHYVHTNHYKHLKDAEEVPRIRGSKAREETASKMPTPETIKDACNILGDTSGPVECIYKIPGNSVFDKHVKTITTAVFDMNKSCLHIYLKNPKTSVQPCLTLPYIE